ncbi:MAG: PEP-CTERM sorting domain-containing protein [Planctomycetota bacterium]|jgi:hypothetical protein
MKRLATTFLLIALAAETVFGDRVVFPGSSCDAWISEPVAVGSGAEDLAAFVLTIMNTTGDATYDLTTFDGIYFGNTGITGELHQHYSLSSAITTPTADNADYATAIDTHFLNSTADLNIMIAPTEQVSDAGPSAEPTDALPPFDASADTDFGSQLTGLFGLKTPAATWDVAYIVAPYGSSVTIRAVLGSSLGSDTIDTRIIVAESGDFDGDRDVDIDDIDALRANVGDAAYDLDADGDADEDDIVALIENFVERTDGGIGTYRGDFNLDGFVDGTDLAIFKAGFGQTGLGYASGNANSDDFINGTDLAIFKANFGLSVAPESGPPAPEPATLGLLAIGASFLLRRKRG